MLVGWFALVGGDQVDVQIEGLGGKFGWVDAAFFEQFPARNRGQISFPICMASKLQPEVELSVVVQQDSLAWGVEQQAGCGQVSW